MRVRLKNEYSDKEYEFTTTPDGVEWEIVVGMRDGVPNRGNLSKSPMTFSGAIEHIMGYGEIYLLD
jgi:hypothetical protein